MKFFLDENLSLMVLKMIRDDLSFKVEHVKSAGLQGSKDKEIADYAKKNKYILITKDLEFGNYLIYPKDSHYGLIILRTPSNFSTKQVTIILSKSFTELTK